MKKFSVEVTFSGGYVFEIEAENRQEAEDIAAEKEVDLSQVDYWDTTTEIEEID